MNNKEKIDRDFLESYMNPSKIERAPEGFTEKVMGIIEAEAPPLKQGYRLPGAIRIPVIASLITAGLIIIAVFAGQAESSVVTAIGNKLKFLSINLPEFDRMILPDISVPGIIVYISVGLLILWLLDLSLNHMFNRSSG